MNPLLANVYRRSSTPRKIWRKVVSVEYVPVKWEWCFGHRGAHSNWLTLECGHVDRRKGSIPIPNRVACFECNQAAENERLKKEATP